MSSGKPTPRRAACLGLLLWVGAVSAEPLRLEALLNGFAALPSAEAAFSETRTLNILTEPLVATGRLSYRRPDYLQKEILSPGHAVFEVSGDSLLVETEQGRRRVSLGSQPLVRAFVEAYRATLAGDRAALDLHYRVELSGTGEHWTLRLEPRDAGMRERVQWIELSGAGPRIGRVLVLEATGDRSDMRILDHAD